MEAPGQSEVQAIAASVDDGSDDKKDNSQRQFRISHVLKAIFFFIHSFLVTSYYGRIWQLRYQHKLKNRKTLGSATLEQIVSVLSVAFSIWLSFVLLGFDTLSVSIFSGLVALGVSVALRDLLSNFVAGILLFWDKSVRVGDVIAIDKGSYGEVTDITMRYLIVQDRNDIEYLVPHNRLINSTVENWTRDKRQVRLKLDIGVAYGSPIEKVKDIMQSVCFDVPRVLKKPPPNPLIMSMGDSAINFQLRFRIADPENGIRNVMSEVYEHLVDRFKVAGIEIPFPQREIRLKTPAKRDKESQNPLTPQ